MGRTPKTDKERLELLQKENLELRQMQLFNDEIKWRIAVVQRLDYLISLFEYDLKHKYGQSESESRAEEVSGARTPEDSTEV